MTAFQKGDKAQVLIRKEWIDCEIEQVLINDLFGDEYITYTVIISEPRNPKHPFINYVIEKCLRKI